jgi:thiamine-monophosphate kinase
MGVDPNDSPAVCSIAGPFVRPLSYSPWLFGQSKPTVQRRTVVRVSQRDDEKITISNRDCQSDSTLHLAFGMSTRSETELIDLIQELARGSESAELVVGIGDDAAVLSPPGPGYQLLATTDQLVENKHFVFGQHPPEALGHKLLARGLSDIAAMGGTPSWFLLSLAIPERYNDEWIECFARGLLTARKKLGVPNISLVGGDISGAECFLSHITATGTVPTGSALLRSGAGPGDAVYVSGSLGGSALGLERLPSGAIDNVAVSRHLWPNPQLELGAFLRQIGASAALDISDGLSTELGHLTTASQLAAQIHFEAIPRFPEATDDQMLHGGEEYELLFTVPQSIAVPDDLNGLRLTRIGEVTSGSGVEMIREGRSEPLQPGGYEHLTGK